MAHEVIIYCSDRRYDSDKFYQFSLKKASEMAKIADFSDIYPIRALGASLSILDESNLPFWLDQLCVTSAAGIKKYTLLEHLDCFYAKEMLKKENIIYSIEAEDKLHKDAITKFHQILKEIIPDAKLYAYYQTNNKITPIIS